MLGNMGSCQMVCVHILLYKRRVSSTWNKAGPGHLVKINGLYIPESLCNRSCFLYQELSFQW